MEKQLLLDITPSPTDSTLPNQDDKSKDDSGISIVMIVGIVIGGIVVVMIIGVVLRTARKNKTASKYEIVTSMLM